MTGFHLIGCLGILLMVVFLLLDNSKEALASKMANHFSQLYEKLQISFCKFKESFVDINHSSILYNSLFTVDKRIFMSLCSKNKLDTFANIIVYSKLEALGRPLTYIKNSSGTRIDPCGTQKDTFCSIVLLSLLMRTYCSIC